MSYKLKPQQLFNQTHGHQRQPKCDRACLQGAAAGVLQPKEMRGVIWRRRPDVERRLVQVRVQPEPAVPAANV